MSKEVKREDIIIELNGHEFPAVDTEQSKGKNAGEPIVVLNFPVDNSEIFTKFAEAVGLQNFWSTVFKEVIRPACLDASSSAIDEATGKIEESAYCAALIEEFLPSSRKASGPSKKDLLELQSGIWAQLTPYISKQQKGQLSQDEKMAFARLISEAEDVATKLESKTRKGKKAVAAEAEAKTAEPAGVPGLVS